MSKRLSSLFLVLLLFVGSQTFSSCTMFEDEDDAGTARTSLSGYWKSSYGDGFAISGTTFTQYDDAAKSVSFAGTIVNDPDLTENAAYLTLKITDAGTWMKTVGKYYVVHVKEYTGTAVLESSAYKSGAAVESGADTKVAAETEFTVANGYFSYYGTYTKQ